MYFPIGWSKTLKIRLKTNESAEDEERRDEKLLSIKASSDKSFLCVLTNFSLRIWFCKVRRFLSCLSYLNFSFSSEFHSNKFYNSNFLLALKQFKSFKPNCSHKQAQFA